MTQKSKDSLLLAEPAEAEVEQLDLPGIPAEFLAAAERRGEYTGDRLFEQKPQVYQTIVYCLAEGLGMIRIGKLLKVSPNTVMAVRDREGEAVDIEKGRLANLYRRGARLAGERIVEDLLDDEQARKIPANQKAVIVGILTEKSELLSGGATSRVAHSPAEPSNEDFDAYLASLRRVRAVGGEGMKIEGEKKEQKGLAGPSPGPALAPPSQPGPEAAEPADKDGEPRG